MSNGESAGLGETRRPVAFALEPKMGGESYSYWVVCSDGAVFSRNPDWGTGAWRKEPPIPGTPAALEEDKDED